MLGASSEQQPHVQSDLIFNDRSGRLTLTHHAPALTSLGDTAPCDEWEIFAKHEEQDGP